MALFGKPKYTVVKIRKREIPEGLWTKCQECGQPIYKKALEENLKVCPKCNYHFTMTAHERLEMLVDQIWFVGKEQLHDHPMKASPRILGIHLHDARVGQGFYREELAEAVDAGKGPVQCRAGFAYAFFIIDMKGGAVVFDNRGQYWCQAIFKIFCDGHVISNSC
mgnify:CR=1 FL=1